MRLLSGTVRRYRVDSINGYENPRFGQPGFCGYVAVPSRDVSLPVASGATKGVGAGAAAWAG